MNNKDEVKSVSALVCQLLNRIGSIMGDFNSAGTKREKAYPIRMRNYCSCHARVLPTQSILETLDFIISSLHY